MTEESLLERQQHLSVIVAAAAIVSVYITHSINIRQIAVIPTQQLRVMTVLIHVSTVLPSSQLRSSVLQTRKVLCIVLYHGGVLSRKILL